MATSETIKLRKLHENAKIPVRQTDGAAGYDIYSLEGGVIEPNQVKKIKTGLSFNITEDLVGVVFGRSGLGLKHGITVLDTRVYPGCDQELIINILNTSDKTFEYTSGYRIAQIVFIQASSAPIELVDTMDSTMRGESGFGSTGVN